MVTPDWNNSNRPKFDGNPKVVPTAQFARPSDRLAAVIVDVFVILAPLFVLLGSPLKRWLTASFILGQDNDFFFMIIALVALAITLIISYQTIAVYYFGTTAGKKLFGLKVISQFPDGEITVTDAFLRSCIWVFSLLGLGLPWLALFSHRERRAPHDRLGDTVVVTYSRGGVAAPGGWESGLVRGFYAGLLLLFLGFAYVQVRGFSERMALDKAMLADAGRDAATCEAVNPYIGESEDDAHARLKMAMSLYAAGLADRSCLEAEVEREISLQLPMEQITYLAQAFIYADDAEVSNAYLDRVCADGPKSVECAMSQVVSKWSDEDWRGVDSVLAKAETGSGYLEIWGVRHNMKQAHYAEALALMENLTSHPEVAEFSLVQRVKAFYNLSRTPEGEAALAQAVISLPRQDATELSHWACTEKLRAGCGEVASLACRPAVAANANDLAMDFTNTSESLARIAVNECQGEGAPVDYQTLSQMTKDENWASFLSANSNVQSRQLKKAEQLYRQVIAATDTPDDLRIDAARRLLEFASLKQAEGLVSVWTKLENKEAWRKVGNLLFNRLAMFEKLGPAVAVAEALQEDQALQPDNLRRFLTLKDAPANGRLPASVPRGGH